ncbi:MAG: hypothetical protein M0Z30_19610 [Actinomycetota bacterium]|nr:hypothetical protein [Actinomycetota bacterium]
MSLTVHPDCDSTLPKAHVTPVVEITAAWNVEGMATIGQEVNPDHCENSDSIAM